MSGLFNCWCFNKRCNSKASYLPRQSHDKLNTTDPVHGSYKLTLTSNEENINQNNQPSKQQIIHSNQNTDIIGTTKCKNLPDVLPVDAKLQHSTLQSTNNISDNTNQITVTSTTITNSSMYQSYPNMNMIMTKPAQSQISSNSTTSFTSQNSLSPTLNLNRNSYAISNTTNNGVISPKFMSRSTIDLKKTHISEAKDKFHQISDSTVAQSENNILKVEKLNAFSTLREFQRTDVVRKLSLEELDPSEGQIVRAELVNTTLSTSPTISLTKSDEKLIYQRDSLRENIEKITQLQSQLMSSHFIENGSERKLLGYTAKTVKIESVAHMQSNPDNTSTDDRTSSILENNFVNKIPIETDSLTSSQSLSEAAISSETENNQKPMQRTEIILRVNAPRTETASQTDEILSSSNQLSPLNGIDSSVKIGLSAENHILPKRTHLKEVDCDNLSKELANLLRSSQGNEKICEILAPVVFKTLADYIFDLYDPCIEKRSNKRDIGTSMPCENSCESDENNSSNKVVLNHKTTNLRYDYNVTNSLRETTTDGELNICDLRKKKEELINRLTQKYDILRKDQYLITDEITINENLGSELANKLSDKVRSIEVTKFKAYVDDVGYITNLLLSLAGRLATMDNKIHGSRENTSEIKILETKRTQLAEQLEEAKRLKEDINRRGTNVYKIIKTNLTDDNCADYDYFINIKAKLIVNLRDITEKIKLCEEQLSVLKDSLTQIES